MDKKKEKESLKKIQNFAAKVAMKNNEWYGIRSLLGYNWAIFFILLGAREMGKSYSVTERFLIDWKQKNRPFTWLRLNEASTKKMLANNAEKLVDADLYRKFDLSLRVSGQNVYDHGKKMAQVLALSTFANDKGTALFDKDFDLGYNIALDEFQLEKTQRSQGDIAYQFVNQLENLVRSTKEGMRIFLIGNTLEEASDILTLFNFIPEEFGRYKLKSKRAVIDYLPPSDAYLARRKGTVADLLMGNQSNFTNKIDFDRSLIYKGRLQKPTAIIHFSKEIKFTVWGGRVISEWNKEKCKVNIAMRPYIDLIFENKLRDDIIQLYDHRGFYYKNLLTNKKFQKEIAQIKPRKQ